MNDRSLQLKATLGELLAAAKTPRPWCLGGSQEPGLLPVDHEGCAVWPWLHEEDAALAYWLVNNAEAILGALS